jgi:hypothetical protein
MTKLQAQIRANGLVKKLDLVYTLGAGKKSWKARVWFNLEWCYAAQDKSRKINVYPLDNKQNTKYNCLISDTPGVCGGLGAWTDWEQQSHRDPVRVVKEALKYSRNHINVLDASLKVAEESWAKSRIADPFELNRRYPNRPKKGIK